MIGTIRAKRAVLLSMTVFILFLSLIGSGYSGEKDVSILTSLVEKVKPCMVLIRTYDEWGDEIASGSGFFISSDGSVITCNHVVEDAVNSTSGKVIAFFDRANVTTSDGKVYSVTDVRHDIKNDLAILSVNLSGDVSHPLPISQSSPQEGEDVFVISSPLGEYSYSVTNGIISSINRTLKNKPELGTILQFSAPVSPGSSGAPVLNMNGEVVGIVESLNYYGENLNFAVPAERIKKIPLRSSIHPLVVEWNRTFGGIGDDYGYSVQQTRDGGYFIVGYTTTFGPGNYSKISYLGKNNVWLIKTDELGNEIWNNTFPVIIWGHSWDIHWSGQQTSDGGYIAAGDRIIKTDSKGNLQWIKDLGSCEAKVCRKIRETKDGGYIAVADSHRFGGLGICLIKIDSNGNEQWTEKFGNSSSDRCNDVLETDDGGYIIAATKYFKDEDVDAWLIKTNSSGKKEWSRYFGGSSRIIYESGKPLHHASYEDGYSVLETKDGGYILAGERQGSPWLVKVDSKGSEEWSRVLKSAFGMAISIQEANDNEYLILSGEQFGSRPSYSAIIKTDSSGNEEWSWEMRGVGRSFQKTKDNGFIIVGNTEYTNDNPEDIFLIKLKSRD